eukprot:g34342.t1
MSLKRKNTADLFTDEEAKALEKRMREHPTPAETKRAGIDREKMGEFFKWANPRTSVPLMVRLKLAYVVLGMIIVTLLTKVLKMLGLIQEPKTLQTSEIVQDRMWRIEYEHNHSKNNCYVIRGRDNSLMMFQCPPPCECVLSFLEGKGELKVIVCPDIAHDANARKWKLLAPQLRLVADRQYKETWAKCGDDSFVDEVFDEQAESKLFEAVPCKSAELYTYYFKEHYSTDCFLTWNDYAHLLEIGDTSLLLLPCALGNMQSTSPLLTPVNKLFGLSGFRVLFWSPFIYAKQVFGPKEAFEQWWRRLYQLRPSHVLVRHGPPLLARDMTQLHLGTDLINIVFPRRVDL